MQVHDELVARGIHEGSAEYFSTIEAAVAQAFPERWQVSCRRGAAHNASSKQHGAVNSGVHIEAALDNRSQWRQASSEANARPDRAMKLRAGGAVSCDSELRQPDEESSAPVSCASPEPTGVRHSAKSSTKVATRSLGAQWHAPEIAWPASGKAGPQPRLPRTLQERSRFRASCPAGLQARTLVTQSARRQPASSDNVRYSGMQRASSASRPARLTAPKSGRFSELPAATAPSTSATVPRKAQSVGRCHDAEQDQGPARALGPEVACGMPHRTWNESVVVQQRPSCQDAPTAAIAPGSLASHLEAVAPRSWGDRGSADTRSAAKQYLKQRSAVLRRIRAERAALRLGCINHD